MKQISNALSSQSVNGALMDSYIAAHYEYLFEDFELADFIQHVFSYGLLLNRRGLWLEKCLRRYTEMRKDTLNRMISSTLKPAKVCISHFEDSS